MSFPALAQNCAEVFSTDPFLSSSSKISPLDQLARWEEQANITLFREPTTPINIGVSKVSGSQLEIKTNGTLPDLLKDKFFKDGNVFWPKHPYNTEKKLIPYANDPIAQTWDIRMSASRSMFFSAGGEAYSIKVPTNFPHLTQMQNKFDMHDDLLDGIIRSRWITAVDKKIGLDPQFKLLKEIFSVEDKKTGNGFLVRDLRPLQDGNYYLPALSIPWVGREIAKRNGQNFALFWKKAYAENLGRLKAKLLLRYGLQMETPNCQNILIQLDPQMKATGVLVLRDMSDSDFYVPAVQAMDKNGLIKHDIKIQREPLNVLNPMTDNSLWRFDEAGDLSVKQEVIESWAKAHDQGYITQVKKTLSAHSKKPIPHFADINELSVYLGSPDGQKLLNDYFKGMQF